MRAEAKATAGNLEMKNFLRPLLNLHRPRNLHRPGWAALILAGAALAMAPSAGAQAQQATQFSAHPTPSPAAEGYLGVDVINVDAQAAQSLKLKEAHGALITLIDHDAPAGKIGLKVNDVILQLNGQKIENAEQLRKMLSEIPPGRKITLEISRDGRTRRLAVKLANRQVIEDETWDRIGDGGDVFTPTPGMGMLPGGGGHTSMLSGLFHFPFFGSSLNVGAMVEPLTSQMAEYLGVAGGVMVKQVARGSEAADAGLRAFDVILKVGPAHITTLADWGRALHANEGKPVQVTILRNKKQQIMTLQVDSRHDPGAAEHQRTPLTGNGSRRAES